LIYADLTQYPNDINQAGFRENARKAGGFASSLQNLIPAAGAPARVTLSMAEDG
jgi:hypothetical protein